MHPTKMPLNIKMNDSLLVILIPLSPDMKTIGHGMSRIQGHIHSFFYLLEGEVLLEWHNRNRLIKAHDFIFIPAHDTFKIKYFKGCKGYMGGFSPKLFGNSVHFSSPFATHVSFTSSNAQYIENILSRLLLINMKDEENIDLIKSYLQVLLFEVKEIVNTSLSKDINNEYLNKFFELIFSSQHKLSVSEYANKLSITPNHLNKLVKYLTQKSATEWIEKAFLQDAQKLLNLSNLSLLEVSESLGIYDQSYFSRKFKKLSGLSPSEYRNRNK